MSSSLRQALRAARLRWVPRIHLAGEPSEPRRAPHWLSTTCRRVQESPSTTSWGVTPIAQSISLRCYSAGAGSHREERHLEGEEDMVLDDQRILRMKKMRVFHTAQQAFLEYLHVTRGLCFEDAEHISKHSPVFTVKLLDMVKDALKEPAEGGEETVFRSKVKKLEMLDRRVSKALNRLFLYDPINEFEPFFESIGLKPSEYDSVLPKGHMFLADDAALVENCRILCNYGVARTKIGSIYWDAMEVFHFGKNVLVSKLQALEDLGFSKASVIKLVTSNPVILLRDPNDVSIILQCLDDLLIERDWIGQFFSARQSYSYHWRKMVAVPQFLSELGFNKEDISKVIRKNPDFLLDGSGKALFAVVITMLKAGSGKQDLFNLLLDFPNVPASNFVRNIRSAIQLLVDIGVSEEDIKMFVVSNASMLGSAQMKKANSIRTDLSVGMKRLCKIIMKEPQQLLKYTYGSKLSRLPSFGRRDMESIAAKVKFLKSIGFTEGSEDMKVAFELCRGKGEELQDRFEFFVKRGLDPKDAAKMIKAAPQVLNQKIDSLESKISFFVDEAGYPLCSLLEFPQLLSFTVERTKSRLLMYNWLQERETVSPNLALSTLLSCSDKKFVKNYVEKHHMGPEAWEKIKREVVLTKTKYCTSDD